MPTTSTPRHLRHLTETECVAAGHHDLLLRANVYHEHRPEPAVCEVCSFEAATEIALKLHRTLVLSVEDAHPDHPQPHRKATP